MVERRPLVAVAGIGGFAADHHAALAHLEAGGQCRVVAACDPDPNLAATQATRFGFAERGVGVFESLEALLAEHGSDLDLLTLPTPIPLHAGQHRLAVEAGVGCYLEKPPSLWWPEFRSMLEVEQSAVKETQVGFNFVGDPWRRTIKQRILSGEFGALREVRLHAVWPRDAAYYGRNSWAGRLRTGESWVIDSCIGNALAHYVQNLLFWCGTEDVDSVGKIDEVRAWLGRTHPIESYDTALVEASLSGGVKLRIGATHAELGVNFEPETLIFDDVRIAFRRWNEVRTEFADGRVELGRSAIPDQAALLRHNLATYMDYLSGSVSGPTTRLTDSEPFVALCDLALISSGAIHTVTEPPDLGAFAEHGAWPSDTPNTVTMGDLPRLADTATKIYDELKR